MRFHDCKLILIYFSSLMCMCIYINHNKILQIFSFKIVNLNNFEIDKLKIAFENNFPTFKKNKPYWLLRQNSFSVDQKFRSIHCFWFFKRNIFHFWTKFYKQIIFGHNGPLLFPMEKRKQTSIFKFFFF